MALHNLQSPDARSFQRQNPAKRLHNNRAVTSSKISKPTAKIACDPRAYVKLLLIVGRYWANAML